MIQNDMHKEMKAIEPSRVYRTGTDAILNGP